MIVVKITTPWSHGYERQLRLSDNYLFEINNDCTECNYWFVWGGVNQTETVLCPSSNVFYITDEAHELRLYNPDFLNQFEIVFAVRTDLSHRNIQHIHEPQIWYFDKSYEELSLLKTFKKERKISIVASDLTTLKGHKDRFAFVNKLIGHFKDRVDVFGRGFNEIKDKWEGLAPYEFSVAIENNSIPNYFTEKLSECFLSYTVPLYYGCQNVDLFFDKNSYVPINIYNYKDAINIIEGLFDSDLYDEKLEYVIDARSRYFEKYHLFKQIEDIIQNCDVSETKIRKVVIKPESYFVSKNKNQNIASMLGVKQAFSVFIETLMRKM